MQTFVALSIFTLFICSCLAQMGSYGNYGVGWGAQAPASGSGTPRQAGMGDNGTMTNATNGNTTITNGTATNATAPMPDSPGVMALQCPNCSANGTCNCTGNLDNVCGSDGQLYLNNCSAQVAACNNTALTWATSLFSVTSWNATAVFCQPTNVTTSLGGQLCDFCQFCDAGLNATTNGNVTGNGNGESMERGRRLPIFGGVRKN